MRKGGGPLNLTLINLINMTAVYREEKAREVTDNIAEQITNYAGWEAEKRKGDIFLLQVTVREMNKLIADGLPDVTREEKAEQVKINRRHRQKLDKIAERSREEVQAKTYLDKIEDKRVRQ